MQRGLKVPRGGKRGYFLAYVSMQRGLKVTVEELVDHLINCPSQCKEDWKPQPVNRLLPLVLCLSQCKEDWKFLKNLLHKALKLNVSMQRGLKVIISMSSFGPFSLRLNAKRIESLLHLFPPFFPDLLVSMQRGLKVTPLLHLLLFPPLPSQCKEDWKASDIRLMSLALCCLNAKRIERLGLYLHTTYGSTRLNAKRIERVRLPSPWLCPLIRLNAKRIESRGSFCHFCVAKYKSQCKEDWKIKVRI